MSIDDFIYEKPLRFNGPVYEPKFDTERLTGQIKNIFLLMQDGGWRTLREIEKETGYPPASISAQLRHLRKTRFGSHIVNKQHKGERSKGLWEYQLVINDDPLPSYMQKRVLFMGDTVKLKHFVPHEMFTQINNWLSKRGYVYQKLMTWIKDASYGVNTQ